MWESRETADVTPIASIEAVKPGAEPDAAAGVLLEAKLVWGGDTLRVRHVRPRTEVTIADLGLDLPGRSDLVIGGVDASGSFGLRLPNGTQVPADCRMTLRLGRAVLRLSLVADDLVVLPPVRPDARVAFGLFAAAMVHLLILGFVVRGRVDAGGTQDDGRATMQQMVAVAEQRALVELAAALEESRAPSSQRAAPAAPEDGPRARPATPRAAAPARTVARAGDVRGEHPPTSARDEAASFGILTIVAADRAATRTASSAFAVEKGAPARESIFAQRIGDSASLGGLGLSGCGEGGGGLGAGVPLSPRAYRAALTSTSL